MTALRGQASRPVTYRPGVDMRGWTEITALDELVAEVGEPQQIAVEKVHTELSDTDRAWLAAATFCLVATSDASGRLDASPKGDPAGKLVHVLEPTTIAIPDRPGNRRVDGYRNILQNPQVGLVFLVPGRGDTLRVNGRARLVREAPFFDDLAVRGKRPTLALVVEIEEIFLHCAKAIIRGGLWQPASWDPDVLPKRSPGTTPAAPLAELEDHYASGVYEPYLY